MEKIFWPLIEGLDTISKNLVMDPWHLKTTKNFLTLSMHRHAMQLKGHLAFSSLDGPYLGVMLTTH